MRRVTSLLKRSNTAAPARPKTRRPFGVTLIAVLQALNAITLGLYLLLRRVDPNLIVREDPGYFGTILVLSGLIVAVGLWRLDRWAWVATMLWAGSSMASALIAYTQGNPTSHTVMALSVLQVFYLNLSDVQRAFQRERAPQRTNS
jgi:hypothetical protein